MLHHHRARLARVFALIAAPALLLGADLAHQAPAALACSVTVGRVVTVQCSRPGTPTDPYLSASTSGGGFSFVNTADGPVVFDLDETRDGQGVRPTNVTCAFRSDSGCPLANTYPYGTGEGGDPTTFQGLHDYFLVAMDPGVRYCLRVRARNWNDGDPNDGLVSDDWSAWTCAVRPLPSAPLPAPPPSTTPTPAPAPRTAPPATPDAPNVATASDDGLTISVWWTNRDAAAAGYVVERKHPGDTGYDVVGHDLPLAPLGDDMSFTDQITADQTDAGLVSYRVCAFNAGGEVCSAYTTLDVLP